MCLTHFIRSSVGFTFPTIIRLERSFTSLKCLLQSETSEDTTSDPTVGRGPSGVVDRPSDVVPQSDPPMFSRITGGHVLQLSPTLKTKEASNCTHITSKFYHS